MNIKAGNLSHSARTSVLAQLRQARTQIRGGSWLSRSNSAYRCGGAFCHATTQQGVEFIASAGVLHLYDGWSYLGNSLRALVKNEPFVVGHLAYYAELRAAMSILASMGIVNFGDDTYCVDKTMCIRKLPCLGDAIKGTHQVLWNRLSDALSAKVRPPEFMRIPEVFKIGGLSLEDWVTGLSGGHSGLAIVAGYITKWGMDIQHYDTDRKIRNKLSYDISFYQGAQRNQHNDVINLLADFWSCFEAIDTNNFAVDYYMLWVMLQSVKNAKGWNDEQYKKELQLFLRTTAMSEVDQARHVDMLTSLPGNLSRLLRLSGKLAPKSKKYYLHIIARAVLMLRIATVLCGDAFRKVGLSVADVSWWIKGLAQEKGLWGCEPENFSDLHEDVKNAIEELQTRNANSYSDFLINNFKSESNPFPILGFSEYIMLWGLPS